MNRSSLSSRALAVLLACLIAFPAWLPAAVGTPQLPDPGSAPISKQEQQQLGLKVVGEVYKQMPILPDSHPLTQYVQSLGKRLDAVIPQQYNWPYQFHVVQQKEINAFALPGGPIFVNIGTITSADNEAQLAGVIAHEMAHVYMQHSAKAMQKQGTTQAIGQILGGILGGMIGGVGGAIAQAGAQIGAGMVSMKYSRADEAQADSVGAIIAYKSGYDPRQIAVFFQKLEKEGGRGPQFLSDHPNPGNRVTAIDQQVREWPARSFQNDSAQFRQIRQQARSVRAYSAQEIHDMAQRGQIRNTGAPAGAQQGPPPGATMANVPLAQVLPSGQFQNFRGPFSIDYPSNWQALQDQQAGTFTLAPRAGVSQGSVAYGVVIGSSQAENARSADDAVNQFFAAMQQSMGLRQTGRAENIRVNGMAAKSVDMSGPSPIQGSDGRALQEHDWVVAIPVNNAVVWMVFVAPERDFSRFRSTYEHMLSTFYLNR